MQGLINEIEEIVKKVGISMEKVLGIGLGLPGNIDEKNIVFNGNRLVLDKAKTTDHCRNAE